MAFTLEKFTSVLLVSVNIRAEMHGQEPVPAVDMKFRLVGSNNLLGMFDTGLKSVLYKPVAGPDDEPELDGIDPSTDMPELRSASIEMPIGLNKEYLGRNLVLDYGLGGKSNIELAACDVNNFRVNCKEGGTVEIDFRVQASGVDEKALGKLGSLVKHDVKVTLLASSEADGTQEQVPGISPFKFTVPAEGGIVDNNPPEKDATEAFLEANKVTPVDAKAQREAERAAKFPNAAKRAAAAKTRAPAAKKTVKAKK